MIALFFPQNHTFEEVKEKNWRVHKIPSPEPSGFFQESDKPFHSDFYPERRRSGKCSGKIIERGSDGADDAGLHCFAVGKHPFFLLRSGHSYKKHIRLAGINPFHHFPVFTV